MSFPRSLSFVSHPPSRLLLHPHTHSPSHSLNNHPKINDESPSLLRCLAAHPGIRLSSFAHPHQPLRRCRQPSQFCPHPHRVGFRRPYRQQSSPPEPQNSTKLNNSA
ncbi:hypothetical protein BKA69DRAFT_1068567 [Paraphysoderma sedebokerense]|nr:hypothetical protein BKA69DRAFT_1068567 [Paraphysoderma sedebokerense]